MDQLSLTSQKQYKKIFDKAPISASTNSIPTQQLPDNLHMTLSSITEHIMQLKIGDDQFDEIHLANGDSHIDLIELSPDDHIALLNKKFSRMVQLLQEEDKKIIQLEDENKSLKTILADKLKESEIMISQAKAEMQDLISKNSELLEKKQNEKKDYEQLEKDIQAKENTIMQLNQNLKQITEDYLQQRDKHSTLQEKNDIVKENITELKKNILDLEEQASTLESQLKLKEKELEDLNKQKSVLLTKIKQSELRLKTLKAQLDKKREEYDKTIKDFEKTLQKNSINIKKIEEIQKVKERIEEQIQIKNEELTHVRNLNQGYEEKIAQLKPLENQVKIQQDLYYNLKSENEILKLQLNDLTNMNNNNNNNNNRNIDDDSKDLMNMQGPLNIDAYKNMSNEEIQREIENLKIESNKQRELINELESKNNQRIEIITSQKTKLAELQSEYVNKIKNLNMIKSERDESLTKKSQLENQVNTLLKKFGKLSDALNDPKIGQEIDNNNEEINRGDYQQNTQNGANLEIENTFKSQQYGNFTKDDYPSPKELRIMPNKKDGSSESKNKIDLMKKTNETSKSPSVGMDNGNNKTVKGLAKKPKQGQK